MTNASVIYKLTRSLAPGIDLHTRADGFFNVICNTTGRAFVLTESIQSLACHAEKLTPSGLLAVGSTTGGGTEPGIALISIHIDGTVATAPETYTRLAIYDAGVRSY